jgi:ribosomal protein S8
MPSFEPEELDIDVEDFIESCSNKEIEDMIEILIDSGYVEKIKSINNRSMLDNIWNENISKLLDLRLRITPKEEEKILKIINKYC